MFAYRTPREMAKSMTEIAQQYPGDDNIEFTALPTMKNVRLAVNVAACDGIPLVVVYGENDEQLHELEKQLAPLAFSDELIGKFSYIKTTDENELETVSGFKPNSFGYSVLVSGTYGLDGKVHLHWAADTKLDDLKKDLIEFANGTKKVVKEHRQHVQSGTRDGADWDLSLIHI